MDIRQLRYFVGVVEAGSFSAAARRLGVAQPALSQHVLALERELNAKLLERGARGVRPTASGTTFLDHALVVLRDLERARDAVSPAGAELTGRVAVGLPTTVAPVLAMPLMRAALARMPGVRLHLVESHSGFLREWLDAGRLDLGLLFNVTESDGLDLVPLIVEDLHLVGAAGEDRTGDPIDLAELQRLDLAMASRPHDLRKTLDDALFRRTGRPLSVKSEIDSLQTLKQMVRAGLVQTVLPLATIHDELAQGSLIARPIVRPTIERHAAMVTVSRRPRTRAQQAIADLLLDVADQLISEEIWPGRRLLAARD